MRTTRLTAKQAKVMEAIERGGGRAQLPASRFPMRTVQAMFLRGLISYRSSGGWTAVALHGDEPEEPGEHILRADLAVILPVLASMDAGFDYWQLYWAVAAASNDHFACCASFDAAVCYGVRKGRIANADWMRFTPGWAVFAAV